MIHTHNMFSNQKRQILISFAGLKYCLMDKTNPFNPSDIANDKHKKCDFYTKRKNGRL